MSTMRMHEDTYKWFQTHPQMWWAAQARWAFGKVAPGQPGIELDENEEPTGYLLFSHPGIDYRDLYILEVCEAGMRYAQSFDEDTAAYLVALQAEKDYAALQDLAELMQTGKITQADAIERIWAEVQRQAKVLGVDPYVEPVEDELV